MTPARRTTAAAVALLAAPLVFFGWMLAGRHTLGNDYLHQPVRGSQSLRFYTSRGLEPMWYPHSTGGFPVGGLFYGQYFHLPAWLTSRADGFWTGDALRLLTVRHLALLALLQGLYWFALRRLGGLGTGVSGLLSLAMVYNLRTLDCFRYAIALDAAVYGQAAWILALAYTFRPNRWMLAALAADVYLLLTCGYPALLPFFALVALVAVPVAARAVGRRAVLERGGVALLAALLGAAVAAPNWMAFSEWMEVNHARAAAPSLEWAGSYAMPVASLAANLLRPWEAEVHSAFGGSTLLVALLLAVLAALWHERNAGLLAAFALALLYALGTRTPVFAMVFAHVPGFSALRAPGRILVVLPLLLLIALVRLRDGEDRPRVSSRQAAGAALAAAGLCALGLLQVGLGVHGEVPTYSPAAITGWWTGGHQSLWVALGVAAGIAGARWTRTASPAAAAVLAAATVGQVQMTMRHGTWTEEWRPSPVRNKMRAVSHLPLRAGLPLLATNELRVDSDGTATVAYTKFLEHAGDAAGCFLPIDSSVDDALHLPVYLSDRVECARSRPAAMERLRSNDCAVSGEIRTIVSGAPCEPSTGTGNAGLASLNERNRIVALTPNLLFLRVETDRPSLLVTPFPDATGNWTAWLDGRPALILSVNAGFLGMQVPAGAHQVGLRYFSRRMVVGHRIALAGALGLVLASAAWWWPRDGPRRLAAAAALGAATAVSIAAYAAWEDGFRDRALREVVLPHDYPALLERQLHAWRSTAP